MTLWFVFALMTAAAIFAVLWPLGRRGRPPNDGSEETVYKDQLAEIDLTAMKVARTIDLPVRPQEVLISPDQKTAYVSCDQSGKVAAISLSDWKVTSMIDAGKGADGLAWAVAQ